jgi:hypothetical protein
MYACYICYFRNVWLHGGLVKSCTRSVGNGNEEKRECRYYLVVNLTLCKIHAR